MITIVSRIICVVRNIFMRSEVWISIIISAVGLYINHINTQNAIKSANPDIKILSPSDDVVVSVIACKSPLSPQSSPELLVTSNAELSIFIANNGLKHATIRHTDITGLSNQWVPDVTDENGKKVLFHTNLNPAIFLDGITASKVPKKSIHQKMPE